MAVTTGTDLSDTLPGTAEADSISGLAGDDIIDARTRPSAPGSGIDLVDGGDGFDTLVVDASGEALAVSLAAAAAPVFLVRSASGAFAVDAYAVERVQFTGGAGNDTIGTGQRGGTLDGGAGIDLWIADLSGLFTGFAFTLGSTGAIAAAGLTAIQNIERVQLTAGAGNDTLTGGDLSDSLFGGEGDDVLDGRRRSSGPGADFDLLDGGEGTDTLRVNASGEAQAVQLFAGSAPGFAVRSDSGSFYVDAYGIERIDFTGGAGNDRIETADRGGRVQGGGGIDHWFADLSAVTASVNFRLGTTTAIQPAGLASIGGIERINLTTGSGADTLVGGSQADRLVGGAGNDLLDARSRPTVPGSDVDLVDGGLGLDTLRVDASGETQAVQLFVGSAPSFAVRSTSGRLNVDAYGIERVLFTGGAGNDRIETADRGGSVLGGGGLDHWLADLSALTVKITFVLGSTKAIAAAGLTGIGGIERVNLNTGAGADSLVGGAQADSFHAGAGEDTIDARTRPVGGDIDLVDGGLGSDLLVVNAAAETQSVQLSVGTAPSFAVRSDSGRLLVDAYNIEKIRFTGGGGDDVIATADRAVLVQGGGGLDVWTADYGGLTAGIAFVLGTTKAIAAAGLTSIGGIERIRLTTGSGADSIAGGARDDEIRTGGGNDTIDAGRRPLGGGVDLVDGGLGTDTLVVKAASETQDVQLFAGGAPSFALRSVSGNFYVDAYNVERVLFASGGGADLASGLAGNDEIATGAGADTLDGGNGDDLLQAGAGDDLIRGGRGADTLGGGAGADRFVYASAVESNAVLGRLDVITDFASGSDRIDLSALDADGLGFNGNGAFVVVGAFTGQRGELRLAAGVVEADIDGNGLADLRILLAGGAAAVAPDIVL